MSIIVFRSEFKRLGEEKTIELYDNTIMYKCKLLCNLNFKPQVFCIVLCRPIFSGHFTKLLRWRFWKKKSKLHGIILIIKHYRIFIKRLKTNSVNLCYKEVQNVRTDFVCSFSYEQLYSTYQSMQTNTTMAGRSLLSRKETVTCPNDVLCCCFLALIWSCWLS